MPFWKWIFSAALLTVACAAALADGDIVYSARYYAPPGSRITTHFHLYRIDPDGSGRRQITFGAHDDEAPSWSPDGTKIAFIRDKTAVGVYDCRTRRARRLAYSPAAGTIVYAAFWVGDRTVAANIISRDGKQSALTASGLGALRPFPRGVLPTLASPDGRLLFARTAAETPCIVTAAGEKVADGRAGFGNGAGWLDGRTLAASDDEHGAIVTWTIGQGYTQILLTRPKGLASGESFPLALTDGIHTIPGDRRRILFPQDESNSTVRPNSDYYRIDLKTGAASLLAGGAQFVVPSPDGKRFVTAPGRDTIPYARRRYTRGADGETLSPVRYVWAAPLQVGNMRTGALRSIQTGLVWVTGADWRRHGSRRNS